MPWQMQKYMQLLYLSSWLWFRFKQDYMSKKCKVNWSEIDGTSSKPKWLQLEKDETSGLFHCPIQECDHDGFQSQRGCRKHVNTCTKHSWFFYFDKKPNSKEITDSLKVASNFSMENNSRSNQWNHKACPKAAALIFIIVWNWNWKWRWLQEWSCSSK